MENLAIIFIGLICIISGLMIAYPRAVFAVLLLWYIRMIAVNIKRGFHR